MNDIPYNNIHQSSDNQLIDIIGQFVKHHRLQQNLSQQQVADAANISRSTLSLLERGETVNLTTLIQVLRVLDLLHVLNTFQIKKQISPIALAKMQQATRKRVSTKKSQSDNNKSSW